MINYIIMCIVPLMILAILLISTKEKLDAFNLFIEGIKNGLKMVFNIFPYILAILVAIEIFRNSSAINFIIKPISPLLIKLGIPSEIIPLCVLRPLSGGASMSMAIDIFKNYGVDSKAGKIVSIIMGGTETTIYSMSILLGSVKIKKVRGILIAGLLADFTIITLAILCVNLEII